MSEFDNPDEIVSFSWPMVCECGAHLESIGDLSSHVLSTPAHVQAGQVAVQSVSTSPVMMDVQITVTGSERIHTPECN